ncbi:MAG TPA: hypothetical protein VFY61_17945 [Pyrinomonadaceae bacterium]|nr:hypothetical protein [Pyrinomonadaceae bacterium]
MRKTALTSFALVVVVGVSVSAQEPAKPAAANGSGAVAAPAIVITAETSPKELARAAFMAQGGEKFRSVKNMMLRGSVQLYPPNSVQSIPGSFSLVTAGDKLRMEIDARPAIVFKQIFDGEQSYSSLPNVSMPPLTRFGLGALARFDQPGFQIEAIADKKKQRGFRLIDPDGYTTDYYLDPKTGRVMSFLIYYAGLTLGTENSKFKDVDGVLVPFNFAQKFEMTMGAFFAEFSVKEAKLNQTLAEDAFAIPR